MYMSMGTEAPRGQTDLACSSSRLDRFEDFQEGNCSATAVMISFENDRTQTICFFFFVLTFSKLKLLCWK